jgi:hypothetical protein
MSVDTYGRTSFVTVAVAVAVSDLGSGYPGKSIFGGMLKRQRKRQDTESHFSKGRERTHVFGSRDGS